MTFDTQHLVDILSKQQPNPMVDDRPIGGVLVDPGQQAQKDIAALAETVAQLAEKVKQLQEQVMALIKRVQRNTDDY